LTIINRMASFFGTRSKTRPGRKNYTTKKGDKVFHRKGRYVRKTYRPYSFRKGSMSKTRKGRKNFTTKKGSRVFHRKGRYVRKSRRPYMM
jgi:hypothetical protein